MACGFFSMIALVGRFANDRFTTTWDYTTLKLHKLRLHQLAGFTTTWDYTTLKPSGVVEKLLICFTTTWDYTTLKHSGVVGR